MDYLAVVYKYIKRKTCYGVLQHRLFSHQHATMRVCKEIFGSALHISYHTVLHAHGIRRQGFLPQGCVFFEHRMANQNITENGLHAITKASLSCWTVLIFLWSVHMHIENVDTRLSLAMRTAPTTNFWCIGRNIFHKITSWCLRKRMESRRTNTDDMLRKQGNSSEQTTPAAVQGWLPLLWTSTGWPRSIWSVHVCEDTIWSTFCILHTDNNNDNT